MEDHNCNLDGSLSNKGVSSAKNCSHCHKMNGKAYRCKHCKYKTHKSSSAHNGSRRNSKQKHLPSGDEHWTKKLQTTSDEQNLCSAKHALQHEQQSYCKCERKKKRSRKLSSSNKSEKSFNGKDSNIFSSLYTRFVDWVEKTRSGQRSHRDRASSVTSSYLSRSRSSSKVSLDLNGCEIISLSSAHSPRESHRGYHASVSSEDSDFHVYTFTSYSSNCSSLTLTSLSTTASDYPSSHVCEHCQNASAVSSQSSYNGHHACDHDFVTSQEDTLPSPPPADQFQKRNIFAKRGRLTSTTSFQPARTNVPFAWTRGGENDPNHQLCATWPPPSKKQDKQDHGIHLPGSNEVDELDGSVFGDEEGERIERLSRTDLREALGECAIAYSDLAFGECIREGRRHKIYRGKWHGQVMIHTYQDRKEDEVTEFLGEVSRMNILRHENIALFMGACLEEPNLAVITSDLKGTSLYHQIHLVNDRMSMHSRVNIARQVAQGMGYLHAKGLVLKKLNSRNVYLEPKVKICLIDYGMVEAEYDRPDYGCVSRGALLYVAPELLRSLRIMGSKIEPTALFSKATDVYAYGTLLFEVLSGCFPMRTTHPECLLWQVAHGRRQYLHQLHCNSMLKSIIQRCWGHLSEDRPTFHDINNQLQENTSLHKRHSTSNPEQLHKLGLSAKTIF